MFKVTFILVLLLHQFLTLDGAVEADTSNNSTKRPQIGFHLGYNTIVFAKASNRTMPINLREPNCFNLDFTSKGGFRYSLEYLNFYNDYNVIPIKDLKKGDVLFKHLDMFNFSFGKRIYSARAKQIDVHFTPYILANWISNGYERVILGFRTEPWGSSPVSSNISYQSFGLGFGGKTELVFRNRVSVGIDFRFANSLITKRKISPNLRDSEKVVLNNHKLSKSLLVNSITLGYRFNL